MNTADTAFPGPWTDVGDLVRAELTAYLDTAARPELRTAATPCEPWTGDELTAHLAETFARFNRMLEQSRTGDLTPPFGPDELDAENLRAVEAFHGDPLAALAREAERFCDLADDPDELMAHQYGPIPVGLQQRFGLADLAIHHHDLLVGTGGRYVPAPAVVDTLAASWKRAFDFDAPADADVWAAIIGGSGRDA